MQRESLVRQFITPLFLYLGLSPERVGYAYLKSAVLYYDGKRGLNEIYDKISKENGVSFASVERSVRSALSVLDEERVKRALGIVGKKITASEFIVCVRLFLEREDIVQEFFAVI